MALIAVDLFDRNATPCDRLRVARHPSQRSGHPTTDVHRQAPPWLTKSKCMAHALNILHVMRTPVGGLFRHVCDLARGQAALGHRVGMIADAGSGGARADEVFAELSGVLALGLSRVPMTRQVGASDLSAVRHVA